MYDFIEINTDKLKFIPHTKRLKSSEYEQYLSAQAIVEAAKKEAADILRQANDAFSEQKRLGYETGLNQAKQVQSKLLLDTLKKSRDYLKNSKSQLTEIVIQAIRKLIGEFEDTELTLKMTNQAIDSVTNREKITLRITPHQEKNIKARINEITDKFPEIIRIEVYADEKITSSGCILETAVGIIDASLSSQLAAIENSLEKQVTTTI